MTIQVTIFGGTGFIGKQLVAQLVQLGATVRVATRRPASAYALRVGAKVGQVVPMGCDVNNDTDVQAAVQGANWVINCIGILAEKKKGDFDRVHTQTPARLAKIAAQNGVQRFVHISALGASAQSAAVYQQSKAAGEQAVLQAFPQATILQPSIVFGPGDGFFTLFARMGRVLPVLPLIGGGHTKFQPVYVGDVVQAVLAACQSPNYAGQIVPLAGPRVYSFAELLKLIAAQTGFAPALLPLPWSVAKLQGKILQKLPGQLLTHDQVLSLQTDNVMPKAIEGLSRFGIQATALEAILPSYLNAFAKPQAA